ncbi:MAG: DeoR-family transcriptional regulator, partial [Verrucomicrobiales bacterium]|nr:DeoR-family transcriptional regulator [Verrucomicrobiales bacterium]
MAQLKRLIAKNKDITVKECALALEVSERTIARYLAQMRAAATHESKYTDADGLKFAEDFTYTDVEITETEMIAMMVAKEDLKSRNAAGLNRGITSTFKKIVSTASAKVLSRMKNWERVISFRLSGHSRIDPKIFDSMVRSAGNFERTWIDYRDPDGKETRREIEILNICNINGEWYGFARDGLRGWKERCFNFCRIKTCKPTGEIFEYPEGWTLDGFLGKSFGVF